MASFFPNGTIFSVSTKFGAPIEVTDYSNANPTVASITGGTITDGDVMLIKSAWVSLNERVARAVNASAGSVDLDGIDTTDTDIYIPGGGKGSILVVEEWVQLAQTTTVEKTGGEQQFYQWQYLEDRDSQQRQRPTSKSPKALNLTHDYDPDLPMYQALADISEKGELVVLKAVLPNKAQMLYCGYLGFDGDPSMTINENMKVTSSFSMASKLTRYKD